MLPLALWWKKNEREKLLNGWRYGSAVEKTTEGQVRQGA
jgi:hypothetical protein